jgi:hypothetical protein
MKIICNRKVGLRAGPTVQAGPDRSVSVLGPVRTPRPMHYGAFTLQDGDRRLVARFGNHVSRFGPRSGPDAQTDALRSIRPPSLGTDV